MPLVALVAPSTLSVAGATTATVDEGCSMHTLSITIPVPFSVTGTVQYDSLSKHPNYGEHSHNVCSLDRECSKPTIASASAVSGEGSAGTKCVCWTLSKSKQKTSSATLIKSESIDPLVKNQGSFTQLLCTFHGGKSVESLNIERSSRSGR
jgi:hypothetical protein